MAWVKVLFRSVGEALCANGLRALAGALPFGEVLYSIAGNAAERFREYRLEAENHAEIEAALRLGIAEVREEARAIAVEVCAHHPGADVDQVAGYLAQVPAMLRQTLKRPAGSSMPLLLSFQKAEDWLKFLPCRLPRFQAGDRPPGVGAWELECLLGIGGFGEVWKARHRHFDGIAPVALKFCLDPDARDRLLHHEATVLNQLMRQGRHPGIVPLLDAFLDADPPCLKYEYVEGCDLAGLAREWDGQAVAQRCLPVARLVADLAVIVGSAHRQGPPVVHRDLKPANVLVERSADGRLVLRITDFGIGALAATASAGVGRPVTGVDRASLATALRGAHTPLYASPQQMRGEPADVRDDVHALGIIWYQLLVGDLAGTPTGLWADDLAEAEVPHDLIRLLGSCVASRPEKRPTDAARLADLLHGMMPGDQRPVPAPVRVEPPPPEPIVAEAPPSDRARDLVRDLEAGSSWLLDLTNKQIGDEGLIALARSPALARRSVLYLSGNQISDDGITALARSPHVANVSRLILWDNQIGDRGVAALAESPHLANLNALDIGRNRIGDAGVIALARSPYMASLGALILVSNQVGDEGAKALAESPWLANLAELKPLNNRISAAGVTALRDKFGKRVRIY